MSITEKITKKMAKLANKGLNPVTLIIRPEFIDKLEFSEIEIVDGVCQTVKEEEDDKSHHKRFKWAMFDITIVQEECMEEEFKIVCE